MADRAGGKAKRAEDGDVGKGEGKGKGKGISPSRVKKEDRTHSRTAPSSSAAAGTKEVKKAGPAGGGLGPGGTVAAAVGVPTPAPLVPGGSVLGPAVPPQPDPNYILAPSGATPLDERTPRPSPTSSSEEEETYSLTSSITNYRFENGRRYHAFREGAYWAPNDEPEKVQEAICHHMYLLTLDGKLFLAPIDDNPTGKVLDIGTGTGIWAMDFADQCPSTSVIGTDLSPIQPVYVPPNLTFEVDDCCSPWLYPHDSFSFIHVRGLYGSIADYTAFYREVMAHLEPGGWVEQVEKGINAKSDDGSVTPEGIFGMWNEVGSDVARAWGKSFRIADESRGWMVEAGFVDVVEHRFKWPLGPWMKSKKWRDIGAFNAFHWRECIEGWNLHLLTTVKGWSYAEVQAYLALVRQGLKDPSIHAYQDVTVVYGRKPYPHEAKKKAG